MSKKNVPLGQYLWTRIASLGIEHVFGVPGDFNLPLLDYIYEIPGLKWLGVCNELNGAYAADGYIRIKGHPAALVTTYGPGELSALNGVAGAYAEHAGMIHIVGMPSREHQRNRPLLHHTLGPGMDMTSTFANTSRDMRTSSAILLEDSAMAEDIDRVLLECYRSRRPGYLFVPSDTVSVPIDESRLQDPLDLNVRSTSQDEEDAVVWAVLDRIKQSQNPSILADVLTMRHGCQQLAQKLVDLTRFPTFSTPVGKGTIAETSPSFRGIYQGSVSFDGVAAEIERSDLILTIGALPTAANTGGFTRSLSGADQVLLGPESCQIGTRVYATANFLSVLRRVVDALEQDAATYQIPRPLSHGPLEVPLLDSSTTGKITQAYLWQRIGRFLQTGDMLFVEAGTPQFGSLDMHLPEGVTFNTQMLWSSIGWSVGAALGGCVAARELKLKGRVILMVGEGSLQMTVQEISSFIRYGLDVTIFVINNDGYSIERAIHGPEQGYNDLGQWDYQKMLELFGRKLKLDYPTMNRLCASKEAVEETLGDSAFVQGGGIKICEMRLDRLDYPWRLSTLVDLNTRRAKQQGSDIKQSLVNGVPEKK